MPPPTFSGLRAPIIQVVLRYPATCTIILYSKVRPLLHGRWPNFQFPQKSARAQAPRGWLRSAHVFLCLIYTKQNVNIVKCRRLCWVPVALRPAPSPSCFASGPPGASCIPRVPSGPSGVSLDPPVCRVSSGALGVSWILQ
jgi:hypothetical protein